MASKILFNPIHQRLFELFNYSNVLFAVRSILVAENFHKLPPVHGISVHGCSPDLEKTTNCLADELWRSFNVDAPEKKHIVFRYAQQNSH